MKSKTLQQTVTFKASPRQVDDMLMDWKKHQSLSSQPAKISRKIGGNFTAWGSQISGFYGRDVCCTAVFIAGLWLMSDMPVRDSGVRFLGKTGHAPITLQCRLLILSGPEH